MCFVFWQNVKAHPLLENKSLPYDHTCMSLVQGPTSTRDLHDEYFKTFLNVPISLKITNSTWFTKLMLIFRSCQNSTCVPVRLWHNLARRGGSYLSYSKILASKTVSLVTYSQKMRWKFWSKWSTSNESARFMQIVMLFGSNLARETQRPPPPFCSLDRTTIESC